MSRGLRNCNPGNIRLSRTKFKGEVRPSRDSAFKQFESMAYGYRAMFVLLNTYHKRYGLSTIRQMISRWAPPTENFTDGYIRFVAERTGIDADAPIDSRSERDMVPIVAAMSEIENGAKAVMADVHDGWQLFAN
ncbi:MAG: structural protein P5 [Alistipes sp.]|nr:structural protein P5 [Alistipes sp.]MBO7307189.1 structural protein P5 [Alistipes sp.]